MCLLYVPRHLTLIPLLYTHTFVLFKYCVAADTDRNSFLSIDDLSQVEMHLVRIHAKKINTYQLLNRLNHMKICNLPYCVSSILDAHEFDN